MSENHRQIKPASASETAEALERVRELDTGNMVFHALEFPRQVHHSQKASERYHEGDIPLDRNRVHLLGIGGSAIAGDLLRDILAPQRKVSVHRGTHPPRDRCGVVISSYSGNTREILEIAPYVTGGLKSVVVISSGGKLCRMASEWGMPIWRLPSGYQPRAALGWSLGMLVALMERWRVITGIREHITRAAKRLESSLKQAPPEEHMLLRAALTIGRQLKNKNTLIFHSLHCTGIARRLASQINENAKQPAYAVLMPEGMHNAIEGIAGGDPEQWAIIYLFEPNDSPVLRESLRRSYDYLSQKGFANIIFPAAGSDQMELTLSRVMLSDFVSLFLAAERGVNPTEIPAITELKEVATETADMGE